MLELRQFLSAPAGCAASQFDLAEIRFGQGYGFLAQQPRQRFLRCGKQHPAVFLPRGRIDCKTQPGDMAEHLALDRHRAIVTHLDRQHACILP